MTRRWHGDLRLPIPRRIDKYIRLLSCCLFVCLFVCCCWFADNQLLCFCVLFVFVCFAGTADSRLMPKISLPIFSQRDMICCCLLVVVVVVVWRHGQLCVCCVFLSFLRTRLAFACFRVRVTSVSGTWPIIWLLRVLFVFVVCGHGHFLCCCCCCLLVLFVCGRGQFSAMANHFTEISPPRSSGGKHSGMLPYFERGRLLKMRTWPGAWAKRSKVLGRLTCGYGQSSIVSQSRLHKPKARHFKAGGSRSMVDPLIGNSANQRMLLVVAVVVVVVVVVVSVKQCTRGSAEFQNWILRKTNHNRCLWNKHSFCTSLGQATQQQKPLFCPLFDICRANCSKVPLRRRVFFHRHRYGQFAFALRKHRLLSKPEAFVGHPGPLRSTTPSGHHLYV